VGTGPGGTILTPLSFDSLVVVLPWVGDRAFFVTHTYFLEFVFSALGPSATVVFCPGYGSVPEMVASAPCFFFLVPLFLLVTRRGSFFQFQFVKRRVLRLHFGDFGLLPEGFFVFLPTAHAEGICAKCC